MSDANFDSGVRSSVEIQTLGKRLIEDGVDPRSFALMACGIGAAMLVSHYGVKNGLEICSGMINDAANGKLELFPALKAANSNAEPSKD